MLIIFGGSFDPPHRGHLRCVEIALAKFPEASLLLVPALQPGAVPGLEKQASAGFGERVAMCDLLLQELPPELRVRCSVSSIEAQLPVPNYTVSTLHALAPESASLLLGEDQLVRFAQWRQPLEILRCSSLLVVGRTSGGDEITSAVNALLGHLELSARYFPLEQRWEIAATGTCIYSLAGSGSAAASSEVRRALITGEGVSSTWISPAVQNYIALQHLYVRKL